MGVSVTTENGNPSRWTPTPNVGKGHRAPPPPGWGYSGALFWVSQGHFTALGFKSAGTSRHLWGTELQSESIPCTRDQICA